MKPHQVNGFRQLRADKVDQRQHDLEGVGHFDVVAVVRLEHDVDLARAEK